MYRWFVVNNIRGSVMASIEIIVIMIVMDCSCIGLWFNFAILSNSFLFFNFVDSPIFVLLLYKFLL